jgi:hypothetical protein
MARDEVHRQRRTAPSEPPGGPQQTGRAHDEPRVVSGRHRTIRHAAAAGALHCPPTRLPRADGTARRPDMSGTRMGASFTPELARPIATHAGVRIAPSADGAPTAWALRPGRRYGDRRATTVERPPTARRGQDAHPSSLAVRPACVPRLRPLLRPRPQTGDARPHAALAGPRPALSHALRSDA